MSAYTQTTAGNWSNTATWGGTGPPGAGDTATQTANLTVDVNTTVGLAAFTTGGTAALTVNAASVTLTIGTGITLTLQGDLTLSPPSYPNAVTVSGNAGSSLTFHPPSGQQCAINITQVGYLNFAGTSGSPCTVTTNLASGGLATITKVSSFRSGGFCVCSYTTFSNMGTSTAFGPLYRIEDTFPASCSITNCTFTDSNFWFDLIGDSGGWTNNFTFTSNIFTGSVGGVTSDGNLYSHRFDFLDASATGTYLINLCSFDEPVFLTWGLDNALTFNDNVLQNQIDSLFSGTNTWTTAANFQRNFINNTNVSSSNGVALNLVGPLQNCYFLSQGIDNVHIVNPLVGATSVNGCIFEGPLINGTGEPQAIVFSNPGSSMTLSVQDNITIPSADSIGLILITMLGSLTNATITFLHNTVACASNQGINFGETGQATAGQIAALKANLFWAASTDARVQWKTLDTGHQTSGGTSNAGAPTAIDYNGSWNMDVIIPSDAVGNTYTFAGNGYQANWTATPGVHDLADQNPNFVDATRNLANWGGTAAGGGTATVAGALTALAANPALIGQATTGLLAWIRAGFRPQNSAYEAASYPSDPSTADAAGNSWPGGNAGIGAMAFRGASVPAISQIPFPAMPVAILAI